MTLYLHATLTTASETRLQEALRAVYEAFADAPKPAGDLSCLDFGPSEEEQAAWQHNDLLTVPDWLIDRFEFYAEDWGTWGTTEELRYLLPRILDRICVAVVHAPPDAPSPSLRGLDGKLALMGDWPELSVLRRFASAVQQEQLDELFARRRPWPQACHGIELVHRLIAGLPSELSSFIERIALIAARPRSVDLHAPPLVGALTWGTWWSSPTNKERAARFQLLQDALRSAVETSNLWDWDE